MKLTLFLSILTISQLWATETYSQLTRLTLKLENIKISDALNEIENQSEFFFLYSPKLIDVERKVDLTADNEPIKDILSNIFGENVNFVVYDRQVILTPNNFTIPSAVMQQRKVTGTVTDKDGTPLPGVNIVVTGTTHGSITDIDGKYSIEVPPGAKSLTISFVGMVVQEIIIGTLSQINVTMFEASVGLDEVVVVGYGTQMRKDVTGSIATVSSKKLLDKPVFNLGQALQGKVAGVKITEVSGEPGRAPNIRIRGTNSINSANDPLYVVDGIVGMSDAAVNMNPNIIQSIEVLKDASATSIYGARGANGVIIITTKRGVAGKVQIEYNGYVSTGRDQRKLTSLDADQTMYVYMQAWATQLKGTDAPNRNYDYRAGTATGLTWSEMPHLFEKTSGKGDYFLDLVGNDGNYYKPRFNTNWWEENYRNPLSFNHQVNIRGGTENAKFGLFLGSTQEQGLQKKNEFNRYTGKFTADVKAFKWLDISGSLNYLRGNRDLSADQSRQTIEVWPMLPVKYPKEKEFYGVSDEIFNKYIVKYAGKWSNTTDFPQGAAFQNVVATNEMLYNRQTFDQITADLGLNFKITKDLSLRSTLAIDNVQRKTNTSNSRDSQGSNYLGSASIGFSESFYWQNENYFNYSKQIGDHAINGLLGLSWQQFYNENFSGSNNTFFDDFYGWHNIAVGTAPRPGIGSNDTGFALNSYFARVNYGYKSKYLATLTGRYDGSSKFGKNNKYGFFPSGSVAWVASQEDFLKNVSQISNLKLRASYGITGNQEIGSYVTQTFISSTNVGFGDAPSAALYPSSFGNADLKWESTTQWDVGFDLGLFKNRISIVFDYYNKLTEDMLLDVPLPRSSTTGMIKKNYGTVENKGIEIYLSTQNIVKKDFTWTTDLTVSHNQNTIKKLGPSGADIYDVWWTQRGFPATVLRIGESIGSMQALTREGCWSTMETSQAARYNEVTGDYKWTDVNNDGLLNQSDAYIRGTPFPKVEMNINNTFTYKNFDFNIEFRAASGFYHANWFYLLGEDRCLVGGNLNSVIDGWTPYNQDAIVMMNRSSLGGFLNPINFDTRWVQDASFIRGEGMTLGYTFPASMLSKIKIQNIRVYLNAKNFSLYAPHFLGLDPEGGTNAGGPSDLIPGTDFYTYPRPSTYSFGINIIF